LNRGDLLPGDLLEYTVTVANQGTGPASNVSLLDPIPAGTSYLPGSLSVASGANTGAKTDVAGDDQAEFEGTNNRVAFRLGPGATAGIGGALNAGESSAARFRVRVTASQGTSISNQASVTFVNVATGATVSTSAAAAPAPVVPELPAWALFGSGLLALG